MIEEWVHDCLRGFFRISSTSYASLQSSSASPGTRSNSLTLFVANIVVEQRSGEADRVGKSEALPTFIGGHDRTQ